VPILWGPHSVEARQLGEVLLWQVAGSHVLQCENPPGTMKKAAAKQRKGSRIDLAIKQVERSGSILGQTFRAGCLHGDTDH